jgi:two-component system NtrC family sensor kinase
MKLLTLTARRKDEEASLKALAAEAPVGICIMQDGRFCYVNSYFPIAIGYSVDELIGRDSLDIVVPEDRQMVNENTRKMLKGEVLSPYQFRVTCKDGSIVWVMATVRSIDYHGKQAILGSYMEVTERRKMVEALRENEERYRLLANSITDIFFAMDEHLRYTYWNKASELLTGIRAQDAIGKSLQEIFPDTPWRNKAEKMYRRALKTQQFQIFVNNYDVDGRHYIFETSAYPSQGSVSVLVKDITNHKQAEYALQAERNKLQSLIDSLKDTVTIQDAEYNIIYQNEPSRVASGGDHLGEKCYQAYEGRDKVCDGCPVEEAFKDGKSHTAERKTEIAGEVAFWDNTASPIRDAEGRIVSCLEIARDVTERKKGEQALRESEERYRTILEEMEDAYFEVDLGGHLTFVNNSLCRDLGYSREELIGLSYKAFTPKDAIDSVLRVFNEVYQTGLPNKGFSWKTIRKGGVHGFAESSVSAMRDHRGAIIGFRGVGRDITERKQTEEKLRQSRENYRALFDSSVIGTFVLDAETRKIVMANEAAAKIFGFASPEEGIGQDPLEYVDRADKEKALDLIVRELFEQDLRTTHEIRATIKDGRAIWISVTAAKIMHAGKLAGLISFTDITEHKRAEEALRQSEENYRVLFDNQVIGLAVLDAETMKIVMVNPAALKMFGLSSAQEAFEAKPFDFILPEDKERYLDITETAVFEQNSHEGYQLKAVTRDGREIWINTTATKITHKGRVAALISFTDITEQMRQRERLLMTDRMASLGELAAGTAHELNNPLTSIIGFSQLLIEREVPDDIREDLKLIYNEAQRAASVTKDLLTFARKHAPVRQPNQINSIIEDVLELRAYVHEMSNIDVVRNLTADLPQIMVDYFQMQQVFLNIIINAEYFMTEAHNGGTLTVTTEEQGDTVAISIADDGPGIPPENLQRIFDPFFTTKDAGKGTGLGLSICHGIVTEHGGQIHITSKLGKGATAFIELPIKNRPLS